MESLYSRSQRVHKVLPPPPKTWLFDHLWYGHDSTAIGRVFILVRHDEVSSCSALRAGFRKVWGIAVSSKNHVTSTVSYDCIRVCGSVVKQLLCLLHCSLSRVRLFLCNISQCRQHSCVYRSSVVEECSNDFLIGFLFSWLKIFDISFCFENWALAP